MRIIETQIDIAASASRVWQILTDFPAYSGWNPFITEIEGRPELGARLRIQICPPCRSPFTIKPTILVEAREWELRWRSRRFMPGFFDGEHSFQIRTHGQSCRFHQSERFTGIMVRLIGDGLFDAFQQGFEEMNAALKLRAEAVPKNSLNLIGYSPASSTTSIHGDATVRLRPLLPVPSTRGVYLLDD